MSQYKITDCLNRKSFVDAKEAYGFVNWQNNHTEVHGSVPFQCARCQRWHIAPGFTRADKLRKQLAPVRCVTDRELHLQMCRTLGVSLEELQSRIDLSKIKIRGPGVEMVTIHGLRPQWKRSQAS